MRHILPLLPALLLLLSGCVYDEHLSSMDRQIGTLRSEILSLRNQQTASEQALEAFRGLPEQVTELSIAQRATTQELSGMRSALAALGDVQTSLAETQARLDEQDAALAALGTRLAAVEAAQRQRSGDPQLAALGGVLVLCPLAPLLWLRTHAGSRQSSIRIS